MPYKRIGKCVYKKNPDGSKGKKKGCSATVAKAKKYLKKLSKASIHSLDLQGGPMCDAEVGEFQRNPNLKKIIQVRGLDDEGKKPGMKTPNFDYFVPMIQRLVNSHSNGTSS